MKVKNTNAHRAADKEYYFATYVKSDAKEGEDDVVQLLLTDKEFERAAKRAEKNTEDLPKHFAIIQGTNEPVKKTEVQEVTPPSFFDWLFDFSYGREDGHTK